MEKDMLRQALIPESIWEYCYIIDGMIYTPLMDEGGNVLKAGNEIYNESSPLSS